MNTNICEYFQKNVSVNNVFGAYAASDIKLFEKFEKS